MDPWAWQGSGCDHVVEVLGTVEQLLARALWAPPELSCRFNERVHFPLWRTEISHDRAAGCHWQSLSTAARLFLQSARQERAIAETAATNSQVPLPHICMQMKTWKAIASDRVVGCRRRFRPQIPITVRFEWPRSTRVAGLGPRDPQRP